MITFFKLSLALITVLSIATAVASSQPTRWLEFEGDGETAQGKSIVLISGDEEYRSEEGFTQLGKILARRNGFDCVVLYAQDVDRPGIVNPNASNIPGLEALETADLMIIGTRFRALPDDQMRQIESYLRAGKPVIGIRTATHAFQFPEDSEWAHWSWNYDGPKDAWKGGFGALVLGTTWIDHHGWHGHESTRGVPKLGHPIANGILRGDIWGPSDVYAVPLPVPDDWQPVAFGEVLAGMQPNSLPVTSGPYEYTPAYGREKPDFHKNDPMMPIAWTKTYQLPNGSEGKAFVSTIGASVDLAAAGTRRLIVNASYWCLGLPVPEKGADIHLVGDYETTHFGFKSDEYWKELSKRIESYAE